MSSSSFSNFLYRKPNTWINFRKSHFSNHSKITAMSVPEQPIPLIDTEASITELMDTLQNLPISLPSLYIDLEGVNLSRKGTVSVLQLLNKEFTTPGSTGITLKDVLESSTTPKAFFDVRRDSDALFAHYGIKLAGVQDIQLMELATRPAGRKRNVNGLGRCGLDLFAPERGGSYEVFNTRPLSAALRIYCIQDVQYMPRLWERYNLKITNVWRGKLEQATRERVWSSQSENFEPNSRAMAFGPVR
ncbi:ribonuclease H-like domain-containing protein [Amylocarpus encephaloides]|uniref:Ribonuclease H-like domain-containing protein n=1 Tax=Amylocarpus encephaloides TaxID=45428 RepID=A0A9P7YG55_9HELO|nr:ribonuclease H-like domain-containing protein [Amylocarpus encephaloides]